MKPHTAAAQQVILSRLSPADQVAFMQTLDYLQQAAYQDGVPEGSIASVLNKQSPAVRSAIASISNVMETPRPAPFMEKWDEHRNATELGFADPVAAVHIKSALDGQEVSARLMDRMGTDADHPNTEPLSMREQISAAADLHEGAHHE